ncbi:AmmeMemoRadiSam system protein A, partial [candidate division KSB1 bacterium]|nr:AmmeMemoRadiSam system protein A [candidate division KSB1 bacterium]
GSHYDAVIIMAPSHREAFKGASVYNGDGYETPLGVVPIQKEIAQAIIDFDQSIKDSYEGHREEHSLEIQLPFLQLTVPDLKIVPISIWDYSMENCKQLAAAITHAVKGKNVLLVVSTDLYHGYSYKECEQMNDRTIGKILAMEPEQLCQGFAEHTFQACGAGPIVIAEMVAMNLGANESKLISRTNSGDVTGNRNGYIVGYAAILLYKSDEAKKAEKEDVGIDLGLTENEKTELLVIARQAVENAVNKKKPPEIQFTSPVMKEYRGAFVTLTKQGVLRGCIGYIFPVKPLALTIQEMAQAAALRDPRFNPVQKEEVDQLEIEISVLTPLHEIDDVSEIEVGKHGILIEKERYSGLLLPQVATEYDWDRETFLEHTCRKAGLPNDAWQDEDTVIKIFSADVFHENK